MDRLKTPFAVQLVMMLNLGVRNWLSVSADSTKSLK
jgi:hypothetical protein